MVVEVIDAPWAGVPARLRWFKWRWICREHACQTVIFLEHDERMCAPGCVWVCGRSVGRSDSCALREPPSLAWLDKLATTWNTVWSHIKPCLRAASDNPARFAGVRVLGVDERCVASPGPTSTGPRELIGIVDHSRGGSSHGPLEWTWSRVGLAPCMRTGWPSAEKTFAPVFFAPVSRSRRWILSRDRKNALDDQLQDATSVLDAFHIVKLAGDAPGEVRRPRPARHDRSPRTHRRPPLPRFAIFCAPSATGSPHANKNASVRPSRQMRHTSVSTSPTFTGQVREVFHQATPAQGQRLAARLIERLPACPIPEIARLGQTLRKWKDAFLAYFDTGGASNGSTEAITDIIELGRRTARGYRNPTSYQLRMLLIAGGLDASTHTQL